MTAGGKVDTRQKAPPGGASPRPKGGRRPAMRWIVHGVMFVGLVVGLFGLLPRLGGVTHEAADLRHARPAFVAAAVVAQAVSLASYALHTGGCSPRSERGCVSASRRGSRWPPSWSAMSPRSDRRPAPC